MDDFARGKLLDALGLIGEERADAWELIARAIQEAIQEEREACAQVAEETPLRSPVAKQRDLIAARIRARNA